jgi:hypothetical protein
MATNQPKSGSAGGKRAVRAGAANPGKLSPPPQPLSFKDTTKKIREEADQGKGTHAKMIAALVKKARANKPPLDADGTELLTVFKPSGPELKKRGLPSKFFDDKCTNNTVLFMADFAFEIDLPADRKRKR